MQRELSVATHASSKTVPRGSEVQPLIIPQRNMPAVFPGSAAIGTANVLTIRNRGQKWYTDKPQTSQYHSWSLPLLGSSTPAVPVAADLSNTVRKLSE